MTVSHEPLHDAMWEALLWTHLMLVTNQIKDPSLVSRITVSAAELGMCVTHQLPG